jgi:hypothetical protein
LQAVLEGFDVRMQHTVPPELYEGLPMPVGLWE